MKDNLHKILVTGGAGFIGSHTVVELINSGYTPIIVDNFSNSQPQVLDRLNELTGRKIAHYKVDCRDEKSLREIITENGPIEGIIHFAAYKSVSESVNDPLKYYSNNIESTIAVLALMQECSIPNLVFSSSCTVYGQPDNLPVTENSPDDKAQSPYGKTKRISENIIQDINHINGSIKSGLLRYFNPIGAHPSGMIGELPLNKPENLVPYITQTAANWHDQLTVYGNDYHTADGTCIRDYIHVVDLAKAHVKALERMILDNMEDNYEVYNLGTGKGVTVMDVINTFEMVTNKKINYKITHRRKGDVQALYASSEKAKNNLDWEAQLSLKDMIETSWNWEKSYRCI